MIRRVKNTKENQIALLKTGYTWNSSRGTEDSIQKLDKDKNIRICTESRTVVPTTLSSDLIDQVYKVHSSAKEGCVLEVLGEYLFEPFTNHLKYPEALDEWLAWVNKTQEEKLL